MLDAILGTKTRKRDRLLQAVEKVVVDTRVFLCRHSQNVCQFRYLFRCLFCCIARDLARLRTVANATVRRSHGS